MNEKYILDRDRVISELSTLEFLPSNIDYFIKTMKFKKSSSNNKEIALFNTIIPEEIIRALGLKPVWCLSGSHELGDLYSDLFPRDTDPVVKSSYGMYKQYNIPAIINYQSDSYRKLSSIIKSDNSQVFTIDMPSSLDMKKSSQIFENEIAKLVKQLKKHFNVVLKPYMLYKVNLDIHEARNNIKLLLKLNKKISAKLIHFLISTYYLADDIRDYSKNLGIAISEIDKLEENDCINLSIIGSPIYFPNDKLIKLLSDLNVNVDISLGEYNMYIDSPRLDSSETISQMISAISKHYYSKNYLPHNVTRKTLQNNEVCQTDGIIYHVLKGQLLYDYNHIKFEKEVSLPILKIETDYNKEDVEQVKIRLEAFTEMIIRLAK